MKGIKLFIYLMISCFMIMNTKQVNADMGPKPSLNLTFTGLEEEEYYVTTLSSISVRGPWRNGKEYSRNMYDSAIDDVVQHEEVYDKMASYKDLDGYYFIGFMMECSETHSFNWTYWPPEEFKILIYFPVYDTFIVTEDSYETYAFDSYFDVNISGMGDISVKKDIRVMKSYDYKGEGLSLAYRILATLIIELLIATIFFYKDKKARIIIILTNIVTQILLNIVLYGIFYKYGSHMIVFYYMLLEFLIIVIEGALYEMWIGRRNKVTGKNYSPYIYSFVGNTVSFFCGLILSMFLPGLF